MDALEYEKARIRMCQTMILKKGGCEPCPLYSVLARKCGFAASVIPNPDIDTIKNNVDRVIKWAKDHPVKTRQSEFLKMFPNAKFPNAKTDGGVIIFCPRGFLPKGEAEAYCEKHDECIECCKDYWLAEVTDND